MIRTAIILFLLLLLPSDALAQLMRDHEAQGLGASTGPHRAPPQLPVRHRALFKHILAVAGLAGMEDRMSIRASAETDNAEAFIERTADKEERLILYNAVFMREIAKKTKDYWSMIAIVAHEVGHHIRLHTMTGEARSCSEMIVGMGSVEAGEFLARDGAGPTKLRSSRTHERRPWSTAQAASFRHEGHARSQLRLVRPMSNI